MKSGPGFKKLATMVVRPEAAFSDCETDQEKIARLADLYADAYVWRAEESQLLDNFKVQLQELRERVESVAGAQEVMRL